MQNRIFAKACAGSSNRFGGTREMERNLSLRRTPGLGFREQTGPRSETNMGPSDLTQIHSSGRAARRDSEAIWLAYVPAHILDSAAKRRYRVQSNARTVATFLVAIPRWMSIRRRSRQQNMRRRLRCSRWYSRLKPTPPLSRKRRQIVRARPSKTPLIE